MRPRLSALLLVASCTSSSSSTPSVDAAAGTADARPVAADGATSGADGATVLPDGATGVADGPTATADGGTGSLTCDATLDAYCSSNACIRHWADVPTCGSHLSVTSQCGVYLAFSKLGVDSSSTSYYDAVSGELVAIVGFQLVLTRCLAGPGTFAVPTCTDPTLLPSCPDAGP